MSELQSLSTQLSSLQNLSTQVNQLQNQLNQLENSALTNNDIPRLQNAFLDSGDGQFVPSNELGNLIAGVIAGLGYVNNQTYLQQQAALNQLQQTNQQFQQQIAQLQQQAGNIFNNNQNANNSTAQINQLSQKINQVSNTANQANSNAANALKVATAASASLLLIKSQNDNILQAANDASLTSDLANDTASQAQDQAQQALTLAQQNNANIQQLSTNQQQLAGVVGANALATQQALNNATQALNNATAAQQAAQQAGTLGALALGTANNAATAANNAVNTAQQAQTSANSAGQAAGMAVATSQQAQQTGQVVLQGLNQTLIINQSALQSGTTALQQIGGLNAQVQQQAIQQAGNTSQINQLQQTVTTLGGSVTTLQQQGNMGLTPAQDTLLQQIGQNAGLIPALVARPAPLTPAQTTSATQQGVCNSFNPGGCGANALRNTANQINGQTGNLLNAANSAANSAEIGLLNTINNKLGNQVTGGVSGLLSTVGNAVNALSPVINGISNTVNTISNGLNAFYTWAQVDRALNVINFLLNLQNAYFLCNGLETVFTQTLSNGLAVLGITDKDGHPLDINRIIGGSIMGAARSILGVNTLNTIRQDWLILSTIYQTGANLMFAVQNIMYSVINALNVIGNMNAEIGNALKKYGVVGQFAFPWMATGINFHNPVFTAIMDVTNALNQINWVSQSILSGRQAIDSLQTQLANLTNIIQTAPDTQNPQNQPITVARQQAASVSQAPVVSATDISTFSNP